MRRLLTFAGGLAALVGCASLQGMDPEQPCLEAGYAIASRTFDCDEDGELANERYERFVDEYSCIPHDLVEEEGFKNNPQADLFHCGYVIRTLSCDETADFGDDLDAWLSVSPACNLVVEHADGSPLDAFDGYEPPGPDVGDPVCTDEEGPPVSFTVINRGLAELSLYWLANFDCNEIYYAPLTTNQPFVQSTYEGHVWVVRNRDSGRLITWFQAEEGLVVEVP